MIEKGTIYSNLVSGINSPSFSDIRNISVNLVNLFSAKKQQKLHDMLESGRDLIYDEALLCQYMHDYGKMHHGKLEVAFNSLPKEFFNEPIEIIDWGCGQGLASIAYLDYLTSKGINQEIQSFTLIEPSELALKRASLHVKKFLESAEIKPLCKSIENLVENDIILNQTSAKLHLFSNILDIDSFDLDNLIRLVKSLLTKNSYFICVSPIYNNCTENLCKDDCRLASFATSLGGTQIGKSCQRSFVPGKNWTLNMRVVEIVKKLKMPEWEDWGFINKENKVVINFSYKYAWDFSEGLAPVMLGEKWGFINKENNVVIPFIFDFATAFSEGLANVVIDKKNGYIDKEGNMVIPLKYDSAYPFRDRLAPVKLGGKWGNIDKEDNVAIPFNYNYVISFHENLAPVIHEKKWGFINKENKLVIHCKYDNAGCFNDGLAPVMLDKKWGYIDKEDNVIIHFKYDNAKYFHDGLAAVKLGEKWGYIDNHDNVVIPFKYDEQGCFNDGLAPVMLDKKWGYIDRNDNVIIPFRINCCHSWGFQENLAAVKFKGDSIIPYEYIFRFTI